MRRRGRAALPAPLLLGCLGIVGLIAVIAAEFRDDGAQDVRGLSEPIPQRADQPPSGRVEIPGAEASRRAAVILARPLFNPNRRPDASVAEAGPGLARLTGVITTTAGRSAIFAGPSGGKPIVVEEGGRIGPYVVGSIDGGTVTLIGPEGQRVLHPAFDPSPQAKPPGVPAPMSVPQARLAVPR